MTRILYWNEHTLTVPFQTGIQRVVRNLQAALRVAGTDIRAVGWDKTGRLMTPDPDPAKGRNSWLLVPEVPMSVLSEGIDPIEIGRAYGLRTAAIIHDLIPAKYADQYDEGARRLYDRYFRMFADADLVFATTHYVANDLRRYLVSQALRVPTIVVEPLAAEFPRAERRIDKPLPGPPDVVKLLSVSTWEPRKNLPRVLRAMQRFEHDDGMPALAMTIVGRRAGWTDYDREVETLAASLPQVQILSDVSDAELITLYATHHASIYPSLEEGFGLPILESLWFATPLLCHIDSSMAEVAPGGGTMMIDMADENAIVAALEDLIRTPAPLLRMTAEAIGRPLRTWSDYAAAVASHLVA
jgi:glycosyltransferase involved in cell wall biosynthesis